MPDRPIDTFEALKNNDRTNQRRWLRELPIVSYGYITEIIDSVNVRVVPIIQGTKNYTLTYDVALVGLSSALFEANVEPQLDDLVLLFSLNKFHPRMFTALRDVMEGEEVIISQNTNGYSVHSMIGILISTFKSVSAIQANTTREDGDVIMNLRISAKTFAHLPESLSVTFDEAEEETPVYIAYEKNRPYKVLHSAAQEVVAGWAGALEDPDDDMVDAPLSMHRSNKAPVDLKLEGATDILIGGEDGDRDAPVNIKLGESADINIESDSGIKMAFKKAFELIFEGALELVSKASIDLLVQGSGKLTIGNDTATLKDIFDEYNDILSGFDTVGSPGSHVTGPGAMGKLAALKAKQGQVLG